MKHKFTKLLFAVFLIAELFGFAGCNDYAEPIYVKITYSYEQENIYPYRAFAEYDNKKFEGFSKYSFGNAKIDLLNEIKDYINAHPVPEVEEIEL